MPKTNATNSPPVRLVHFRSSKLWHALGDDVALAVLTRMEKKQPVSVVTRTGDSDGLALAEKIVALLIQDGFQASSTVLSSGTPFPHGVITTSINEIWVGLDT